ncbi:calhepatin [Protopterus annectens]|uniref:calhepatin n=1 Tax=Protopterus annectens TaxID=7888 RepID=UPI001CFAA396|nr:calhepatin [Protopterus annectens]
MSADEKKLRERFVLLDKDKSGNLSVDEIYQGVHEVHPAVSRDDIVKLIEKVDTNKDGQVSWQEFLEAFKRLADLKL